MRRARLATVAALLLGAGLSVRARAACVGDLVTIRGIKPNHLVGLGLVVGLRGTGDGSAATRRAVARFIEASGLSFRDEEIAASNSALVVLTAELPPFSRPGKRIDVTVSAPGAAASLKGGTLITTPLWAGSPRDVYARAQGPVVCAGGDPAPVVGKVVRGGIVERSLPPCMLEVFERNLACGRVTLDLARPSARLAATVAEAVGAAFGGPRLGGRGPEERMVSARAVSPGEVDVVLSEAARSDPVGILAEILDVPVEVRLPARIVINSRTGAVAASGDIEVAPASVSVGTIFITIDERAGAPGEAGAANAVSLTKGAKLQTLIRKLSGIQVAPSDLAEILTALVAAGALQAELVVE